MNGNNNSYGLQMLLAVIIGKGSTRIIPTVCTRRYASTSLQSDLKIVSIHGRLNFIQITMSVGFRSPV